MNFVDALQTALTALRGHVFRSFLTSLAIAVGIATVVTTASLGDAAAAQLDRFLSDLGKNVILIRPGASAEGTFVGSGSPLTLDDVHAIRNQVGHLLVGVAPSQAYEARIAISNREWPTLLTGTTPELQVIRHWVLDEGRFLNGSDLKQEANVCVL